MVSRFLGGGSAYLSNGSSGFRKEEEESNACEEEENEERELEGRNPINLFIKRFSCLCRGGVCRVPTGNTRRLKECCRIQRGRESPRFRQDTEGSTKVASLNGITTCYVVAPTSGKETRKLTSSCIYIYTYLFLSLSPLIFPSRACRVLGNTGSRRGGDEKKKEETRINGGDESGRPILSFFSPEETAVRH